ncbi:unnamed protein product [Diplocarpon coronariae]
MKGLSTFAVSASLLSICTAGLQLQRRTDGSARVVGFPFEQSTIRKIAPRDELRRRANTAEAAVGVRDVGYFTNVTLGTPAQSFRLALSTGSSDLWVNADSSDSRATETSPYELAEVYSANDSSTYSYISSDFKINYPDGSEAKGDYAMDKFTIGTATLEKLQFGIGYERSLTLQAGGVLGIGYEISQVQAGKDKEKTYRTLSSQMVEDGLVQSNAYSIWLENREMHTGKILFGGVDTAKFTGTLQTLPIQETDGRFAEFLIPLTAVSFGDTVIAENQAEAALLDTGCAFTHLPEPMASNIYQQVGARYVEEFNLAFVPCSLKDTSTTLDFTFAGATISVPMDEMVLSLTEDDLEQLSLPNDGGICLFGISPVRESRAVLGSTFIRSAYLVFDLANNEISIAQTISNPRASHVLEITKGTSSVPNATRVVSKSARSRRRRNGGRDSHGQI